MNVKLYFGTLFLLFISFGLFQEQVSMPNQEIILEFVDTDINSQNIEDTVAEVKEKLLKIGVSNININKTQNGTLKISYYSVFHIDNIKEELTKQHKLVLNQKSDQKEKGTNFSKYSFDIHELTNETDISNSDYKFVFEAKYNSDRFTTYNYFAFVKKTEEHKANQLFKTTYKVNKNNPFAKERTSHKEPEVRAGPKYYFS